jgi:hypothetical protein
MPLSIEQRARFEQIRSEGLAWADRHAAIIADATNAQTRGLTIAVEVEFRYLVLNAANAALERDDRERDARARDREVRATLFVAGIATLATLVQAIAMVLELWRGR